MSFLSKKVAVLATTSLLLFGFCNSAFSYESMVDDDQQNSLRVGINAFYPYHKDGAELNLSISGVANASSLMEHDAGYGVSLNLEYLYGSNFGVGLELGYHNVDSVKDQNSVLDATSGLRIESSTYKVVSLMPNFTLRTTFIDGSSFSPYVGAGLGFGRVEVEFVDVEGNGTPAGSTDSTVFIEDMKKFDEDKFTGCAQLIAGFAVPLSDRTEFNVGYKYFTTFKPEIKGDLKNANTMLEITPRLSSHQAFAGVSLIF